MPEVIFGAVGHRPGKDERPGERQHKENPGADQFGSIQKPGTFLLGDRQLDCRHARQQNYAILFAILTALLFLNTIRSKVKSSTGFLDSSRYLVFLAVSILVLVIACF